jgi:hypothetical protein
MTRMARGSVATMVLVCCLAIGAPVAAAAPAAGPEITRCGKFKPGQQRNACKAQNKANRIAFNQIKNSRFVGVRGDGEAVDDIYCASGEFESRTSGYYGTGVSTGSSWSVADATVKQGGKWIDAFVKGADGYEVGLLRRGDQWQVAIASLGRLLEPGDVEKSNAAGDCAKL